MQVERSIDLNVISQRSYRSIFFEFGKWKWNFIESESQS